MRDIDISCIDTTKQRADVLAKPLGGPQHALALKAVRLEKLETLEDRDKNVGMVVTKRKVRTEEDEG